MKTEVKRLDKLKHTIRIEVKDEEFLKEKRELYRANSKHLKVPGFRPGSAPLDVLEKHHGKLLREEFLKKTLPHFYQKALEESKISPAGLPRIRDVELTSNLLSFHADFEAKPKIDIKENLYKGIKIKDYKFKVEDLEIEKVLTNLKEGIKKTVNKDLEDQELAKWASYPDVSAIKEAIGAQLLVEKLRERKQKIDKQVRVHLLKAVKIDLPKDEIERFHKELVDREIHNLRTKGVSGEDLDKYKKDLEDKMKPLAEEEVKLSYILEAIAKNEGIKIDNNFADIALGLILSQAEYQK